MTQTPSSRSSAEMVASAAAIASKTVSVTSRPARLAQVITLWYALRGAGGDVQIHLQAIAHHADRIVNARLLVENELLRQQVNHFAVGEASDTERARSTAARTSSRVISRRRDPRVMPPRLFTPRTWGPPMPTTHCLNGAAGGCFRMICRLDHGLDGRVATRRQAFAHAALPRRLRGRDSAAPLVQVSHEHADLRTAGIEHGDQVFDPLAHWCPAFRAGTRALSRCGFALRDALAGFAAGVAALLSPWQAGSSVHRLRSQDPFVAIRVPLSISSTTWWS